MNIGGLDVGTTGCKLTIYDQNGNYIYNSYKEYEVSRTKNAHEIDAENVFASVCECIKDVNSKYSLSAFGVTTFGETFVALDKDDKPLMGAMLYTDKRGEKECEDLVKKIGEQKLIEITGTKPNQMYSLPKMLWIKENEPEIFKKVKHLLLMQDYIIYMLTGEKVIDYSLACRTMAFDINTKTWSDEILNVAGIDKNLLSKIAKPFNVAGTIKQSLKEKLGLKDDIKVVNGAHDQVACSVGAGVFNVGEAIDTTGTVECLTPVFSSIPKDKAFYDNGYSVVPYVFEGTFVCYAFTFTAGALIKWFRDNFAKDISYDELNTKIKDGPTGILTLNHFAGAATPYMDNFSKGALVGVTLEHNYADIYKAFMEGITYEMMTNIEILEKYSVCPTKLYAVGGGAKSNEWLSIKADILNKEIISVDAIEAGSQGTCMITGVALGVFKDLFCAKKLFVKEKDTIKPNKENVVKYKKYFEAHKKIYSAVRPIVDEIL